MMKGKTFLVFGCLHLPVASSEYIKWLWVTIAERRPDIVVINGDLIDAESLSKYEPTSGRTLKDEYDSVNEFMETLNDITPNLCQRVIQLGNHEERLQRPQHRRLKELLDFRVHCPAMANWKINDYEYHPRSVFKFGQLTVAHGFTVSEVGARTETLNFGCVNGLHIRSHTHRAEPPRQLMWGKTGIPAFVANTGCGIDYSPDSYFRGYDTSQWSRGCIYGWAAERPNFSRPCWSAEYLHHSNLWDT